MWCRHCKLVSKIPILPCSLGFAFLLTTFFEIAVYTCSKELNSIFLLMTLISFTRTKTLRWPNTVLARALVDALTRAQGFQKINIPSTERSFYLLNTRSNCVIFLYNCMQCIDGFSILLQRYFTKGNDAKNPAFLAFVCYRKNPVKCNACAVARKIETELL